MISLEKETQKAVIQYLQIRNIFHWRNNSGATKTIGGGFIRFGAVGSPDVFVIYKGTIYGLEVKDVKGRLSEGQVAFQDGMTKAGGVYVVVRSLDDVLELFK